MQSHNERSYAGAAVRICAYLVDQLIVLMVIGVVAGFLGILRLLGLDVILDKEILFTYTVSAIIYYIVIQLVLKLGLSTDDLKLLSAIVVALFLAVPYWKANYSSKHVKMGV